MDPLPIAIFAVTYALISARRFDALGFDRPAGALLGAVACVALGVLTPDRALAAIHGPTLVLLFGVMGMGSFLGLDGFFDVVEARVESAFRTPTRLLGGVIWGAGALAALITNDAVCVLGAPLVVRWIQRYRLPPLPFLLALATGANTGSVATLVGNPQNMLCAALGGLSYREHLIYVLPLAIVCLAINHGLIGFLFRAELRSLPDLAAAPASAPSRTSRRWAIHITVAVIVATAGLYTLGADLAWAATGGFVALMLLHRRDTRELWPRIDWPLLVFFAGLFVVVEALLQSGAPGWLFARFPLQDVPVDPTAEWGLTSGLRLSAIFLAGSNIVSNVPFILVIRDAMASLPHPRQAWELLAVVSTLAGNLTLLGSVANIIVAERARDVGGIGFFQHLRVGIPLTLLTTAVGTVWLVLLLPSF